MSSSIAARMLVVMLKKYERLTQLRQDIQDEADGLLSSNPHYILLQSIPVIEFTLLAEAEVMKCVLILLRGSVKNVA